MNPGCRATLMARPAEPQTCIVVAMAELVGKPRLEELEKPEGDILRVDTKIWAAAEGAAGT